MVLCFLSPPPPRLSSLLHSHSEMSLPISFLPFLSSFLPPHCEMATGSSSSPNLDSGGFPTETPADSKPLAHSSGLSLDLILQEPVVFLQGNSSGHHPDDEINNNNHNDTPSGPCPIMRGSLIVSCSKPTKIRTIVLTFRGKARTEWPEGIPPRKQELFEERLVTSHKWPYFNANFPMAEYSSGADLVRYLHSSSSNNNTGSQSTSTLNNPVSSSYSHHSSNILSAENLLSLGPHRSFSKSEHHDQSTASKGYRLFEPGDYIYHFELPIQSSLPETIECPLGGVKYELEAVIERPGAFKSNLVGKKQVLCVRTPAQSSLELSEPIAISREWEDQLHYDIVIGSKAAPIGSTIPVAFKLTPLAKVKCHRIRIFITENIEYFCRNRMVHRIEPMRKISLFEFRAKQPQQNLTNNKSNSNNSGSSSTHHDASSSSNNNNSHDSRSILSATRLGSRSRSNSQSSSSSSHHHHNNNNTPDNSINNNNPGSIRNAPSILQEFDGDQAGPSEFEFQVKIPSVPRTERERLHPDTTYGNIKVNHWIKVALRLSKVDPDNPEKRKHFEISIDSPFHLLSELCTQANVSLPAYTDDEGRGQLSTQGLDITSQFRPMHLIRRPSFNPPPFDAFMTPPPNYDSIVRDGYFDTAPSSTADSLDIGSLALGSGTAGVDTPSTSTGGTAAAAVDSGDSIQTDDITTTTGLHSPLQSQSHIPPTSSSNHVF